MTESGPGEDLVDRVADLVMRGQDPDVENLIAARPDLDPALASKLRKLASAFGPGRHRAQSAAAPTPLPLTRLGPYRILSRRGEGGMGVVYMAEHEFLARRVALKVIRPELAFSEVTRGRFQREAMSIAALRHENIVSVYDAGELDGVLFMAMELVDGRGIDELLQSAQRAGTFLDAEVAVRHAREVALALECAHEAGIVHRDVKPSNVIITSEGRAMLLDFGLCLAEDAAALSSAGQFRGTPQYASPEQLEMDSAEIDARTDVYSLGITLYECLTGQVPFGGGSMRQLFQQIVTHDAPEPRARNPAVDARLNAIVMRAMARRREDRYASAGEMALALEGWLGVTDRGATLTRSHRARRISIVALVVLLGLSTGGWWLFHARGSSAADVPLEQPVVRAASSRAVALFAGPDEAFLRRLEHWDERSGPGTFGPDDEGPGAIGVSVKGISAMSHALLNQTGSIRGRIEPLPSETPTTNPPVNGEITLHAAGLGVEFTNGRIVALMMDSTPDGYELHMYEMSRTADAGLTRGALIEPSTRASTDGRSTTFELSWNDTDTQFDCSDSDGRSSLGTQLVPRRLRAGSRPSRALLLVENGSARFDGWTLEES